MGGEDPGDDSSDLGSQPTEPSACEDASEPLAIPSAPPSLPRGTGIGRYVVVDRVGAGGMGVVYRAFDPDLDRKVAIKLVRVKGTPDDTAGSSGARLIREAKAIAQLTHPHVVTVHDVGTYGEHVYIVMELIDGPSVKDWLESAPRSWREVLEVFLAAGRGLAAAHEAGLIHRDFKPDNVLIGSDARVRVLDFGLARALAGDEEPVPNVDPLTETEASSSRDLETPMTETGVIMGTPAYMAPEQHLTNPTDAKTDQFCFCASLYQGLYGKLPYEAESRVQQAMAVLNGKVRPPPKGSPVPPAVFKTVLKGLSVKPDDRHASMNELLATLERHLGATRRRWQMAGGAAAAVAVLGVVAFEVTKAPALVCDDASQKLDGVWDGAVRAKVQQAFADTKAPYATDAWTHVSSKLDAHTKDWSARYQSACVATNEADEQNEPALYLRMACLTRHLNEVRALSAMFVTGDAAAVKNAAQAVQNLPSLESCDNAGLGGDAAPPVADRARVAEQYARLAEVSALQTTGKYKPAAELANDVLGRARAIGYKPLEADALFRVGLLEDRLGDRKKAEQSLLDAATLADSAGQHVLAAKAWSRLVWVVGYKQAKFDEGLKWAKVASAAIEKAGDDEELRSSLSSHLCVVHKTGGDLSGALPKCEEALAVRRRVRGPDTLSVASALNNLGMVKQALGRYADALTHYEQALATGRRVLGASHPRIATYLNNVANAHAGLGNYGASLKHHEQSMALQRKTLGDGHPRVGAGVVNVSEVLRRDGQHEAALAKNAEGLAILETAVGGDHPHVGIGRRIRGDILLGLGRNAEALEEHERALAIHRRAQGDDHPNAADDRVGIGEAQIALDAPSKAIDPLERALAVHADEKADPVMRARAQFAMARALSESGGDAARALDLAKKASATFRSVGARTAERRKVVEAWIAERAEGE